MNYLLFTLVVSLCIFYFYNQYDGFQTSPVDFTNFSGTLTGIRVNIADSSVQVNGSPADVLKTILGGDLTGNDIKLMMERPNGDVVYPYFYINPTGNSNSGGSENIPYNDDPYNVGIMPEMITGLVTRVDPREISKKMMFTFNFSRNPKVAPIVLTNQNIKLMFNNVYTNLYKMNLKVVSLILNNTIDYPTVDYSQYSLPVPILTPKVSVNLNTRVKSITVKTSLLDILQRFQVFISQLISQNAEVIITSINPDGTTTNLIITSETSGGTNAGTSGGNTPPGGNMPFRINNGNIQATSQIGVYRINFFDQLLVQLQMSQMWQNSNVEATLLSSGGFSFGQSQNAIRFLFENSPKIPDSVIQSFIGGMLLLIRSTIIQLSNGFGTGAPYTPEQIVSINLINPSQEIKVDIGTEMNINTMSPSSVLDQLKKLLCV